MAVFLAALSIEVVLCRAKVAVIVGMSKQCREDVEGRVGSGSLVFYVSLVAAELGHQVWSQFQMAPLRICLFELGKRRQGLWRKLSKQCGVLSFAAPTAE